MHWKIWGLLFWLSFKEDSTGWTGIHVLDRLEKRNLGKPKGEDFILCVFSCCTSRQTCKINLGKRLSLSSMCTFLSQSGLLCHCVKTGTEHGSKPLFRNQSKREETYKKVLRRTRCLPQRCLARLQLSKEMVIFPSVKITRSMSGIQLRASSSSGKWRVPLSLWPPDLPSPNATALCHAWNPTGRNETQVHSTRRIWWQGRSPLTQKSLRAAPQLVIPSCVRSVSLHPLLPQRLTKHATWVRRV